jgi:CheY-like chemotaxis protein
MSASLAEPARVLIVDDDESDITLIIDALAAHRLPSDPHVVHDGVEALEYLRAGPRPDVIVLDLNMPRMGGREVLEAVKQDPDLVTIPVVIFTTSGQPDDITASYSRHANAYITKPLDLDDFNAAVDRVYEFYADLAARPRAATR